MAGAERKEGMYEHLHGRFPHTRISGQSECQGKRGEKSQRMKICINLMRFQEASKEFSLTVRQRHTKIFFFFSLNLRLFSGWKQKQE
jgi:hypothetical protein